MLSKEKINQEVSKIFNNLNKDIEWIKERTCFLTISGSHSQGLATPESDIDFRGIAIPTKEYFFSFHKNFDQLTKNDPDAVIFSIKKFFRLAAEGNPNCVEIIFTEPEDHIIINSFGLRMLENRDKFLSKQVKERYVGFARSQMHRIAQHRRWLFSKMEKPPTRESLGLPEKPLIEKKQFDVIKSLINKKLEEWNPHFEPFSDFQKIYINGKLSDILSEMQITHDSKWTAAARTIGLDENFIYKLQKEKEYESKLEEWNNYLNWKKNRNPKRAELEAKCGFDAKHACQLLRLLVNGKEILDTGKLIVKRTHDREELMEVKRGLWTYEKLMEKAESLESEVKKSYLSSSLPNQPNVVFLDTLCTNMIQEAINGI